MTGQRRGRGRPRAEDTEDRRAAILAAARTQFASKGFGGASLRAIAGEAGCDVSLIGHYFGDKSQLLVATLQLPVDPVALITSVIADGTDGMAERLLHTFLGAWDPHRDVFSTLIRTTLGSADAQAPGLQVAREIILDALLDVMEGDDHQVRATLVLSGVIGMATLRYVAQIEPLASAEADEVVRQYAPALQVLIDR